METKIGVQAASPLVKKMAAEEEGNYASLMSTDIGLQQTDQGLTLPPKIDSSSFDLESAFLQEQNDYEEALRLMQLDQAEPDDEEPCLNVYELFDLSPSAKRRRLDTPSEEVTQQIRYSEDVIGSQTQSSGPCSPGFLPVDGKHQQSSTQKETTFRNAFVRGESYQVREHQKELKSKTTLLFETSERTQKNCSNAEHFITDDDTQIEHYKASSNPVDDCRVDQDEAQNRRQGNQPDCDVREFNTAFSQKLAGSTQTRSEQSIKPPNVAWLSFEKQWGEVGPQTDYADHIACDVPTYSGGQNTSLLGVQNVVARDAPRTTNDVVVIPQANALENFSASQDAVGPSLKITEIPRLVPISTCYTEKRQLYPLTKNFTNPVAANQIPSELRQRFDALIKKYIVDKQFYSSVEAYIAEMAVKDISDDISDDNRDVNCDVLDVHPKDLSGLTLTEIIDGYRELERDVRNCRRALIKCRATNRKQKDNLLLYKKKADGVPRPLPKPFDPMPNEDKWICENVTQKGLRCGKPNKLFVTKSVWAENLKCSKCHGPPPMDGGHVTCTGDINNDPPNHRKRVRTHEYDEDEPFNTADMARPASAPSQQQDPVAVQNAQVNRTWPMDVVAKLKSHAEPSQPLQRSVNRFASNDDHGSYDFSAENMANRSVYHAGSIFDNFHYGDTVSSHTSACHLHMATQYEIQSNSRDRHSTDTGRNRVQQSSDYCEDGGNVRVSTTYCRDPAIPVSHNQAATTPLDLLSITSTSRSFSGSKGGSPQQYPAQCMHTGVGGDAYGNDFFPDTEPLPGYGSESYPNIDHNASNPVSSEELLFHLADSQTQDDLTDAPQGLEGQSRYTTAASQSSTQSIGGRYQSPYPLHGLIGSVAPNPYTLPRTAFGNHALPIVQPKSRCSAKTNSKEISSVSSAQFEVISRAADKRASKTKAEMKPAMPRKVTPKNTWTSKGPLKNAVAKKALPQKKLTEPERREVEATNNTLAFFTAGPRRKLWEKRLDSVRIKEVIEIQSDEEEDGSTTTEDVIEHHGSNSKVAQPTNEVDLGTAAQDPMETALENDFEAAFALLHAEGGQEEDVQNDS